MNIILHCFICRPSNFTVSEDAGIFDINYLALTKINSNFIKFIIIKQHYNVKTKIVYFFQVIVVLLITILIRAAIGKQNLCRYF
jgi:hypothetical protein